MQEREQWGSRLAFVLAAAGSAIGLGNIWKFPYITHENGGGSFVLLYLFCIAIVGLPVIIAEMMVGRATKKSPVAAIEELSGKNSPWKIMGLMGVAASFIILSFYAVVAGWVMHYTYLAFSDSFSGMKANQFSEVFNQIFVNPWLNFGWATIFMAITLFIVIGGVKDGIEKAVKILMPVLIVIMILLVINSIFLPNNGFEKALKFIFLPTGGLHGAAILEALGHAFFTLSLGMGAMLTYGSYLDDKTNLFKAGLIVVALDTIIALLACIIIFSIMFAYGGKVSNGAGLVFISLPQEFAKMNGGYFVSIAFFLLLFFAALTSAISLLEVPVAYLIDKGWARKKASFTMGISIWLLSIPCALSNSEFWKNKFASVTMFDFKEKTVFFNKMDYLASNWLLPLGGLLIAVYVGWFISDKLRSEQFKIGSNSERPFHYIPWVFFTAVVSPIIVSMIILIEAEVIDKKAINQFFDGLVGSKTTIKQIHK
ncbi:MAG: sodium-dependent transporter [Candidatus Cloacimonadota bacterium]|nr:MAG: sodium-dependent transporter [Candidatus Cloacimonadota bacterium]